MGNLSTHSRRRIAQNVLLGLGGALIIGLLMAWSNATGDSNIDNLGASANARPLGPRSIVGFSLGSAYAAYIYLAITLLIGPGKVFRGKRNPISTYLRRDFGIWTALFAIIHTVIALQIYPNFSFLSFFLVLGDGNTGTSMRLDNFGLANYFGLIATIVFFVLLCLSSNYVLKAISNKTWKSLQRWVYVAAFVTLLHGIIFMIGDGRSASFVYAFIIISVSILVGQLAGFISTKRQA
jgi:DMSO/TMAO reductase YedYZ heme-binding membrane subunit